MKTKIMNSLLILLFFAFALVGCYEVPGSIFHPIDPDEENARTPVITSVDKTFMWTDDTLTITGSNFSDSLELNLVYFSGVSTPVIGTTTIVKDSLMVDGLYTITTPFKVINISTSDYVTTITSTINSVVTTADFITATNTQEYTVSDTDRMVLTAISTVPVFTSFDTTVTPIDTVGYTKMIRTVTTYGSISDWVTHSSQLGTVVSASATELKVIPPEMDVVNSRITIHVQNAIAPAEWDFIDLMVKP